MKLTRFIAGRFSRGHSRFVGFARIVAFLSVMLGSLSLIVSLAVLDGFELELRENSIKFISHILVQPINRRPLPLNNKFDTLQAISGVKSAAPIWQRNGLIRGNKNVEGILISSFELRYDISDLQGSLRSGTLKFTPGKAELAIGKRLADKLGVGLGDRVILYAMKGEGEQAFAMPSMKAFTVAGIYESGMPQYDDIYVYIPSEMAPGFFSMPANTVSHFAVMADNVDIVPDLTNAINNRLGYPFFAYNVFDRNSHLFAWIEFQKAPIPLVLGLISIVAVLNIVTILLITVVEKTHSIGILRALGMKKRDIMRIFISNGFSIGLAGTVTGSAIAGLMCWIQNTFHIVRLKGEIYYLDILPMDSSPWHYIIVISISLLLSLLATLVPSYIAIRVKPLRALNFR